MRRDDRKQRITRNEFGDTTIIVPQRNHAGLTAQCLESIRRTDGKPWPILVVDDGSDPFVDLKSMICRNSHAPVADASVHVLRHERQRGVTAAWNTGARCVKTPFAIWLNNDVIAEGPWVERLITPLRDGSAEVVGVGWRTERAVGSERLRQHDRERLLEGWCFAARKSTWETLGGFDEAMAVYWSDTDFFVRAKRRGLVLEVVDEIPLRHLGHRTAHDPRCLPSRHVHWRRDREAFLHKFASGSES